MQCVMSYVCTGTAAVSLQSILYSALCVVEDACRSVTSQNGNGGILTVLSEQ